MYGLSESHRAHEPRNLTRELSHKSAHENAHGSVHIVKDIHGNAHKCDKVEVFCDKRAIGPHDHSHESAHGKI